MRDEGVGCRAGSGGRGMREMHPEGVMGWRAGSGGRGMRELHVGWGGERGERGRGRGTREMYPERYQVRGEASCYYVLGFAYPLLYSLQSRECHPTQSQVNAILPNPRSTPSYMDIPSVKTGQPLSKHSINGVRNTLLLMNQIS